jgi:hypothetical protein
MKTLHETKEIDRYLLGKLGPAAKLLFEARLLINPSLKLQLELQHRLYSIIKISGRRQIKSEVARIHHQLFSDPAKHDFQTSVLELFHKK